MDLLAGTHIYFGGNFTYGNINGPCSINSNGKGAFVAAAATAGAGSSAILVNTTPSGWGVGWPLGDYGTAPNGPVALASIPVRGSTLTTISSVTGGTLGLSNNVSSPGVTSGDLIVVGTTTDGDGINFDTLCAFPYTGEIVAENNIAWNNGNSGFEVFCNGTSTTSSIAMYVRNNTLYGNVHDPKHDSFGVGLLANSQPGQLLGTFSFTNNIVVEDVTIPLNSITNASVGEGGTGEPVQAAEFGQTGLTVAGNWFTSASGATCNRGGTCNSTSSILQYNGANYKSGNTLGSDPGFANPTALPTSGPSCASYSDAYSCMHAAGVDTDLVPSASGTSGKGYQSPGACASNIYYPMWLKGVVYLEWKGTTITETAGLITKPCNM